MNITMNNKMKRRMNTGWDALYYCLRRNKFLDGNSWSSIYSHFYKNTFGAKTSRYYYERQNWESLSRDSNKAISEYIGKLQHAEIKFLSGETLVVSHTFDFTKPNQFSSSLGNYVELSSHSYNPHPQHQTKVYKDLHHGYFNEDGNAIFTVIPDTDIVPSVVGSPIDSFEVTFKDTNGNVSTTITGTVSDYTGNGDIKMNVVTPEDGSNIHISGMDQMVFNLPNSFSVS